MTFNTAMDDIALGIATAKEARNAIRKALSQPSAAAARETYAALRSWVWKALDSRRRDSELRDWHQILKAAVGVLQPDFPKDAARIDALADLVHEAVVVGEVYPVEAVTQRQHVKDILFLVHREADFRMSRGQLRI
jgi:hypothetical protein